MLLLLQKTMGMLVMPMGLLWLAMLGLAFWSWRLRRPAFATALSLLWVMFTLAGNPWMGRCLVGRLEQKVETRNLDKESVLDAVFVLGGGSEIDSQGRPQLGASGDRIAEAARLWHAGRTRHLVASGRGNDALGGERDLAQETRTLWLGLGVPDSAIRVVEPACYITREEIAAYRRMCDQQQWSRVGLLTSAAHLPRALKLAQKAHLDATPLACDFLGRPRRFRPQDLIPQHEGLRLTQLAVWELIGRSVGR